MEYALWHGKKILAEDVADDFELERSVRKASALKMLRCADSECSSPLVKYCHGEIKGAYFAHYHNVDCAYARYDKMCEPYRNIKLALSEHFSEQGESVDLDVKVFGRHYCPMMFYFSDGTGLAVEFGTKRTSVKEIEALEEEYATAEIGFVWIVIGELNDITEESEMFYLKRHLLNKTENSSFILIDKHCEKVCEYLSETRYDGKINIGFRKGDISSLVMCDGIIKLNYWEAEYWGVSKENSNGLDRTEKEVSFANGACDEKKQFEPEKEWEAILSNIDQQETQVRDSRGVRYVKCEICGKVADSNEFVEYGGIGRINKGICRDCQRKKYG